MTAAVALCTHNGARFLEPQLASMRTQSYQPAVVVLSDDASTDDTVALARRAFAGADSVVRADAPQLRIIENRPALGVTKNFEGAVRAAAGTGADLIALSDQDDVWHADKLERAARVFAADPAALLLFTDARLVDGRGAPLELGLFESLGVTEAELGLIESGDALPAFLRRNLATGATVVLRRELLELALPFPASWVHDEWLAIVAAVHGGVRVLREQTIDYRQHGGNEIGVNEPTLGYKIRRMLEPRGTRNELLAAKFADLAAWARATGLPADQLSQIEAKAAFELTRSRMPEARLARIPSILRLAARGLYPRYASQGTLDIARDLLQRP
ncbi:glycosyltransferase family 2 protein [Gryllotalpicola daejeonensis]|uniref:Glycosyltransferase family 2 protein n=1 Tax=Gryllotalpicola daejeonensis TaxID=993087 RepID=A0ABP7ZN76_9MICO